MAGDALSLMMPFTRAMDRFAGALETIGRGMESFKPSGQSAPGGGGFNIPKIPGGGKVGDALGKLLPAVSVGFGKLGPVISGAISGFAKLLPVVGGLTLAFSLAKKTPIIGDLMKVGQSGFGLVWKKFVAGLSFAVIPLGKFSARADATAGALDASAKAANAYADAVVNSAKFMSGASTDFMDSVSKAITNPFVGLPELAAKIKPFVEAFNPFVVEQFDDAMRSVYAIIGEALVPVMKMAAEVVREFAGYLRPALADLRPVFEEMGGVVGELLKDIIPELVSFIKELVPAFRLFLDQLKESTRAQKEAIKTGLLWATGQISLLETIRRGVFNWLSRLPFIGKMFKSNDENAPIRKDLVEKENIFSFGAASAPTYRASESLGRDTLQAAYAAMPGMEKKKEEVDFLKEIAENTKLAAERLKGNGFDANTYDSRVKAGLDPNASIGTRITGAAQWWAGQATQGIYNFGNGVGNLWSGKSWSEGAIDI